MDTIGQLNRRITFHAPLTGRDDLYGGAELRYIESVEVWAGVEFQTVGSGEQVMAGQLSPRTSAVFTIRYKDGLNTGMEIEYDGLRYKILSILPQPGRAYMLIETEQIGGNRETGISHGDGQTLTDESGNTITLPGGTDVSGNYSPPKLKFTDDEDNEYYPS